MAESDGLDFPGVSYDEEESLGGLLLHRRDGYDDGGEIEFADGGGKGEGKKKIKEGSFLGLGIDEVVRKALVKHGYRFPTPIQRKVR